MEYLGYYINLDRSTERRQFMEEQLAACDLQSVYQRHPASPGNVLKVNAPKLSDGAVGCFTSHYLLLQSLSQANTNKNVHIIEDDVVLSPSLRNVIDSVIKSGMMGHWDLLCTDVLVQPKLHQIRNLNKQFEHCTVRDSAGVVQSVERFILLDLKEHEFISTASYIVNGNSIEKVAGLLKGAFESDLDLPIDLFFCEKVQQGQLTAACLFPFVTARNVQQSLLTNINDRDDISLQKSILSTSILRDLFYVHSNPQQLLNLAAQQLGDASPDPRGEVVAEVFRFMISPEFKIF